MNSFCALISSFLLLSIFTKFGATETKRCGYGACNLGKEGMLNVHIVSHTHDDVGWVLTVEQYYRAYVRDIIHSVIYHLNEDETRRFVYVESAFFQKWWAEQSSEMQKRVKILVNTGRLEFVGGGWVMNDEAVTHYEPIIEQMTLGLRFLNETFGECAIPKTVWQIDPFGHSREQASLFAQMHFDGLFLGRIDYEDIATRKRLNNMEFVWKGSESLGKNSNIFTGVLPNVYWPPKGFCFDVNCWDEEITDQNVNVRSRTFIEVVKEQAKQYKTNHTIITMGMDFYYRYAGKWFRNLEKLMASINAMQANGSQVNAFYSTPSCYLKAIHSEDRSWATESEDFMPYASEAHSYWTGYYTSRPSLKYYSRRAMAFLQTCRQLATFASMPNAKIGPLKEAVSILQHHDAITGTEKLHVAKDYARMLSKGIGECQAEIKTALSRMIPNVFSTDFQFCDNLNNTECLVSENEAMFKVIAYNSLSRKVHSYLRLPVMGQGFEVRDAFGNHVPFQVLPLPSFITLLPDRTSYSRYELVFPVSLPAIGATSYTVKRHQDYSAMDDHNSWTKQNNLNIDDSYWIENEFLRVKVNQISGLLESVVVGGVEIPLQQNYFYYVCQPGFQNEKPSGAYSFNPLYDQASRISANATITVLKGELVEEIWQHFGDWVSQVIRVYKGKPFVEFDWVVGPIPARDYNGKEVISRFQTNWDTQGVFYTDSNSRQTMKRVRNQRQTWNLTVLEPVSGNYYPITGWIYIKDEAKNLQLTLLTDRAQGGSSIEDGSLELMVHRRTLYDDGYGVDEALNELGPNGRGLVVRGKHLLLLSTIEKSTELIKDFTKELYFEPSLIFLPLNESFEVENERRVGNLHFSTLQSSLPPNIHLLTLELISQVEVLIRLEHIYEAKENINHSVPVAVSLKNLFCPFEIVSLRETSLSANQYLEDVVKLNWKTESNEVRRGKRQDNEEYTSGNTVNTEYHDEGDQMNVLLGPMEIRTFLVKINRSVC